MVPQNIATRKASFKERFKMADIGFANMHMPKTIGQKYCLCAGFKGEGTQCEVN